MESSGCDQGHCHVFGPRAMKSVNLCILPFGRTCLLCLFQVIMQHNQQKLANFYI